MYVQAEQRRLLDAVSSSNSLSVLLSAGKRVVQTVLALAGDRREQLSTHMYATYTSRSYYLRVVLIRSELLTVQLKFQGGGYSRGSIYSKKYGMYLHYT